MIMDTKQKMYVVGGLSMLVMAVGSGVLFFKVFHTEQQKTEESVVVQEVSTDDPVDIVLDYYGAWLEAVKSTSTNPHESGLTSALILSATLSTRLKETQGRGADGIDPVLCQTTVPEQVTTRTVFEFEDRIEFLVMAKGGQLTGQATVSLKRHNDGWYIDNIVCSSGESVPQREFSFEKEGFLLKSVPPPLDPQYWYVVFEDNNELGHYAPLFFDAESLCVSPEGIESMCQTDQFMDAMQVRVYGQMTESGVQVKRIEVIAAE